MKPQLIITQINIEHHRRAFDKLLDQKPKKSETPKTTTPCHSSSPLL